eukprot:11050465-Alexandrium_andersonii.AAC.1
MSGCVFWRLELLQAAPGSSDCYTQPDTAWHQFSTRQQRSVAGPSLATRGGWATAQFVGCGTQRWLPR